MKIKIIKVVSHENYNGQEIVSKIDYLSEWLEVSKEVSDYVRSYEGLEFLRRKFCDHSNYLEKILVVTDAISNKDIEDAIPNINDILQQKAEELAKQNKAREAANKKREETRLANLEKKKLQDIAKAKKLLKEAKENGLI